MKGKIDSKGVLWKEVPGGEMIRCTCVNDACGTYDGGGSYYCYHACVAFEGPVIRHTCTVPSCITDDPELECRNCEHWGNAHMVKICDGRELFFDEFVDERVQS